MLEFEITNQNIWISTNLDGFKSSNLRAISRLCCLPIHQTTSILIESASSTVLWRQKLGARGGPVMGRLTIKNGRG